MSRIIEIVSPSPEPTSSSPSSPSSPPSPRPGILPLFITCDPARDTPSVLKSYLSEFHDSILGLTGTWEQTRLMCKAYRVYFSTPEGVMPGMDYLVDHSIYFYLMGELSEMGVLQFPIPYFLSRERFKSVHLNRMLTHPRFFLVQIRRAISSKPLGGSIARSKQLGSLKRTCRIGEMGKSCLSEEQSNSFVFHGPAHALLNTR